MEINIGMSECHKNVDNYYGSHITVWIPRCAGREAFDGVEPLPECTYYYRTAFGHRLSFYRVLYLPLLFYRVYNLLTAYPQTAYLVHNHFFPQFLIPPLQRADVLYGRPQRLKAPEPHFGFSKTALRPERLLVKLK